MQFTDRRATELLHRWQRIQMHVRCGLSPEQPGCVRLYLHTGLKIARSGLRPATAVHLAMLRTLLGAAQDEALPWFWRSVCLEHVNLPLAQLQSLIGVNDPIAMQAIDAAVQRTRDRLPLAPAARDTAA
jgi:hypothetical protein